MSAPDARLVVDDLVLEVRRSGVRRTIGVTVERDGALIVRLPDDASLADAAATVRAKQLWIYAKLARKAQLMAVARPREFVPGEGFYYLGRSYRLRLVDDAANAPLRLYQGRFELGRTDAERGRQRFASWYRARAMPWIQRRIALHADRIGAHPTRVSVGSLGHRWGSCGPDGALRFHWRVILLPGPIAEYLVIHELAHLRVPRHSPEFWRSVERVLPDYRARRAWLDENGARYDV